MGRKQRWLENTVLVIGLSFMAVAVGGFFWLCALACAAGYVPLGGSAC